MAVAFVTQLTDCVDSRLALTKKMIELAQENLDEINRIEIELFNVLEKITSVTVSPATKSLDISIAGNRTDLNEVIHALRTIGYDANLRPEKDQVEYYAFWKKPDSDFKIWMNFSSTSCKRVFVGHHMVQEAIYKIECTDEPES